MDTSFLLGAQAPPIANPLDLALKGTSLQALINQAQMGGLELQQQRSLIDALQNPDVLNSVTGGGPGISPEMASQYGPGMAKLLPMMLQFQKTRAETALANAQAGKTETDTQNLYLTRAANIASSIGPNATPQDAFRIGSMLQGNGVDVNMFDQSSPGAFVQSVADGLRSEDVRSQVAERTANIWHTYATTAQAAAAQGKVTPVRGEYGYTTVREIPNPAQLPPLPPAMLAWMNGNHAGGGGATPQTQGAAIPPGNAPPPPITAAQPVTAAATAGGGAPAGGGAGGPVFMTPGQKMNDEEASKLIQNQQVTTVQPAHDLQAQLMRMRDTDARGIYDGPLGSSKLWKDVTGIFSPMMTPEERQIVANSQEFGAQAGQVLAKYAQQIMGGRMSRSALQLMQPTKPSDYMNPAARHALYDDIYNGAQRSIDYWTQAGKYRADPKNTGLGLSGFAPTYSPDVHVPVTPGSQAWTPQQAVQLRSDARTNPMARQYFDANFGTGAARQVLGY